MIQSAESLRDDMHEIYGLNILLMPEQTAIVSAKFGSNVRARTGHKVATATAPQQQQQLWSLRTRLQKQVLIQIQNATAQRTHTHTHSHIQRT